MLNVTSYQDLFPAGALSMITSLQNLQRGRPQFGPLDPSRVPASPRYQAIMGPGGHASGLSDEIALEWFDTWIKGIDTGMQSTDRPLHGRTVVLGLDSAKVLIWRPDGTVAPRRVLRLGNPV